jgi:hypothetical protein
MRTRSIFVFSCRQSNYRAPERPNPPTHEGLGGLLRVDNMSTTDVEGRRIHTRPTWVLRVVDAHPMWVHDLSRAFNYEQRRQVHRLSDKDNCLNGRIRAGMSFPARDRSPVNGDLSLGATRFLRSPPSADAVWLVVLLCRCAFFFVID